MNERRRSEHTCLPLVPAYAYGIAGRPAGILRAVVGSCVAVCGFDATAGVGALAHLAVPDDDLLDAMLAALARHVDREDKIRIKLFGGANVIKGMRPIGTLNGNFARDFVRRRGLSLDASDLGGDLGRRIEFNVGTGRVRVRKIAGMASEALSAGMQDVQ